jgi:hypothetical protein
MFVWSPSGAVEDWLTPLPPEVHQHAINFLDIGSVSALTRSCKQLWELWQVDALWRTLWDREAKLKNAPCGVTSISRSHTLAPASGAGAARCCAVTHAIAKTVAKCDANFDVTDTICQYGIEAMYFVRRRSAGSLLLLQPFVDSKTVVFSFDETSGSFELLNEIDLDQCFVYTLNVSATGEGLFQGGDGLISVWDISAPEPSKWTLSYRLKVEAPEPGSDNQHISCLRQTALTGEDTILASSKSGSVQLWDLEERKLKREVLRAPFPVTAFSLTDGLLFVASGATFGSEHFGAVTVWDFEHGIQLNTFRIAPATVLNANACLLSIMVHGRFLIATDNCYVGRITVMTIDAADDAAGRSERAMQAHSSRLEAIAAALAPAPAPQRLVRAAPASAPAPAPATTAAATSRLACPACGFKSVDYEGFYGTYCICEVCDWEDDPLQLQNPATGGCANTESLIEWQLAVLDKYPLCTTNVGGIIRDERWRPLSAREIAQARSGCTVHPFENKGTIACDRVYWRVARTVDTGRGSVLVIGPRGVELRAADEAIEGGGEDADWKAKEEEIVETKEEEEEEGERDFTLGGTPASAPSLSGAADFTPPSMELSVMELSAPQFLPLSKPPASTEVEEAHMFDVDDSPPPLSHMFDVDDSPPLFSPSMPRDAGGNALGVTSGAGIDADVGVAVGTGAEEYFGAPSHGNSGGGYIGGGNTQDVHDKRVVAAVHDKRVVAAVHDKRVVAAVLSWSEHCRGTAGFSILGNFIFFITKDGALVCHELDSGKLVKEVVPSSDENVTDYEFTGERLITFSEAVSRDSDMVLRAWELAR